MSEIAPSAPIARAARAFGDDYPLQLSQRWLRVAGVVLAAVSVWYLPWMVTSLNPRVAWLAAPFAVANVFTVLTGLLSVVNSWRRSIPVPRPLTGREPFVGVIIPTCGEPVPMILRTVQSVLDQDWPHDRLQVVVSDDGHDPALREALDAWPVLYHVPPPRWAPGRDGAAKAGNLNSARARQRERFPETL
jgi:cellulose synthase (UDP-forming)